jgi:hypothetical protein
MSTRPAGIRVRLGVTKMTDGIIVPILKSSLKGLTDNADLFTKPPIDLGAYAAAVASYEDSLPAAMDGSKTAVERKNKPRADAIRMYTMLGHYVEGHCNNAMATFVLLGFQPITVTRTATPPASESIRKVEPGVNSGQIVVTPMRLPEAGSYELRWAPVPPDGVPTAWTNLLFTKVRPPRIISGLTPGTIYAFQIRALVKSGLTDWSDSVTLMCVQRPLIARNESPSRE